MLHFTPTYFPSALYNVYISGYHLRSPHHLLFYYKLPTLLSFPFMSYPNSTASQAASSSSSDYQTTIKNALDQYKRRTKIVLLSHPLVSTLQHSDTSILDSLRSQLGLVPSPSSDSDESFLKWLTLTINLLHTLPSIDKVCLMTCLRFENSYSSGRCLHPRLWYSRGSESSFQYVSF